MIIVCTFLHTCALQIRLRPRLPLKRSFLMGLMGWLVCMAIALPGPVWAQKAGSDNATSQEKALESLLQAQQEALLEQFEQVSTIEQELPQVLSDLKHDLQKFTGRLNALIRLKGFIKNNFNELVILKRNLSQLQEELRSSLLPATKLQRELDSLAKKIRARQKELRSQLSISPQAIGPKQARTDIAQIGRILNKIENLQERLAQDLQPAQELRRQITEFEKLVSKDLQSSWKVYFLQPSISIFKLNAEAIKQQFSRWQQNLPVYAHLFVIGNFNWPVFLVHVLVFFSLFFMLALTFIFLSKRRREGDLPFQSLLAAPIFISLALAILMANTLFQSSFQSLFFQILGQIILGWGIILLLWKIRFSFVHDSEFYSNPLRLLWFPFALSLLLQYVILPPILTSIIWIVLLGVFILFFKRHKQRIDLKLERAIYFITMILFTLFILVILAGWVHLSLLLTSLWFVFCICLQVGNCFTALLRDKIRRFPETTLGFLGRGLVQGVGVPILWLISFSFILLWLGLTLGDFEFLNELSQLKLGWGKLSVNLFRLFLVLIGFYLARSGLVILKSLLQSASELHNALDAGTLGSLSTLLTYGVWAVYILVALAFLGLDLTSLTVVAGGLSVGIGFGLQSIFNNFISGIIILFGRSIQPGDIVQIRDLWAEVKEINIRTTEVQTFDRSTILLPNSKLISEEITNWTHRQDKTLRRKVVVGVAYGSDIELVRRLLMYIADTHPQVLKIPAPFVRFAEFGSNSLEFTLYFFASIDYGWMAESDLRFDINKIFREYGIEIAFPQHDVHIRSVQGLHELAKAFGSKANSEPQMGSAES